MIVSRATSSLQGQARFLSVAAPVALRPMPTWATCFVKIASLYDCFEF